MRMLSLVCQHLTTKQTPFQPGAWRAVEIKDQSFHQGRHIRHRQADGHSAIESCWLTLVMISWSAYSVVIPWGQCEVVDLGGVEGLGDLLFVGLSVVAAAHTDLDCASEATSGIITEWNYKALLPVLFLNLSQPSHGRFVEGQRDAEDNNERIPVGVIGCCHRAVLRSCRSNRNLEHQLAIGIDDFVEQDVSRACTKAYHCGGPHELSERGDGEAELVGKLFVSVEEAGERVELLGAPSPRC